MVTGDPTCTLLAKCLQKSHVCSQHLLLWCETNARKGAVITHQLGSSCATSWGCAQFEQSSPPQTPPPCCPQLPAASHPTCSEQNCNQREFQQFETTQRISVTIHQYHNAQLWSGWGVTPGQKWGRSSVVALFSEARLSAAATGWSLRLPTPLERTEDKKLAPLSNPVHIKMASSQQCLLDNVR